MATQARAEAAWKVAPVSFIHSCTHACMHAFICSLLAMRLLLTREEKAQIQIGQAPAWILTDDRLAFPCLKNLNTYLHVLLFGDGLWSNSGFPFPYQQSS